MSTKKTILVFSTAYLPFLGGAELAIKDITDRISDYSFILITARMRPDLPPREQIGNVVVCRVGVGVPSLDKILLVTSGIIIARRIMREHEVYLFWGIMASFSSMIPAILKFLGFYKDIPFLLTLQEGDSERYIARGRIGLVGLGWRFMLRQANHVQVISRYLDGMARAYGYTGNITLVPNGVDVNKYKVEHSKHKTENTNTIITVSRLVKKNCVDVLINALVEVRKKTPDATLTIAGDGPLRSELEKLARSLGITDAVTFLGTVKNNSLPDLFQSADIFVRPSRSEGLGTAFLEAMAGGLPVIGTPVGGIVDFLRDGETGLLSKVNDPVDLAEKITMLVRDDKLYKKLQDNGYRLVKEKYTWDGITLQMKTIFTNLCAL